MYCRTSDEKLARRIQDGLLNLGHESDMDVEGKTRRSRMFKVTCATCSVEEMNLAQKMASSGLVAQRDEFHQEPTELSLGEAKALVRYTMECLRMSKATVAADLVEQALQALNGKE